MDITDKDENFRMTTPDGAKWTYYSDRDIWVKEENSVPSAVKPPIHIRRRIHNLWVDMDKHEKQVIRDIVHMTEIPDFVDDSIKEEIWRNYFNSDI